MRATAPHRMCAPDLLGLIMLAGLAYWVTRAVIALGEHPRSIPHLSRVIRS